MVPEERGGTGEKRTARRTWPPLTNMGKPTVTVDVFIIRALAALVLGLVVGLDREIKNAPVGIRTFGLVAMGAAAYTMLTLQLDELSAQDTDLSVDPSRLIQGLIGGIGFLGAGAIIGGSTRNQVRGIATGAAVWVAGSIGVACGLGLYRIAAAISVLATVLLVVSELAEHRFGRRNHLIRKQDSDDD